MMTESIETTNNLAEKNGAFPARSGTTANPKIRAGIVGAGLMGRWHADALEKAGGSVVGFVDFERERAARLAAKFSNAEAFGELEKMLAERNIDVLHVCSPTESHQAIAEKAIRAGVHLLIEKPLTATARETAKLYDLAAEHQTLLCPVHQFAFQDGATKAKENLARIGRLVHLEAQICSAGGGGFSGAELDLVAADILPHPLSLVQKFLEIDLSGIDWRVLHPAHGEIRLFAQAGEVSLSILISLGSRPTGNSFRLLGSEGTLHLDLFHGYSILEPGGVSKRKKILHPFDLAWRNFSGAGLNLARRLARREPAYPGLRELIRKFYEATRSGGAPPIKPSEAIAVAAIRDWLLTDRNQRR